MTLKKDPTLKKNWLFIWKIKVWAVESVKICTLMDYFCREYVIFELARYRGVVPWKMSCGFKNDISNLVNFHTSSWNKLKLILKLISNYLKEHIFWTKEVYQISTFWTFHCLSEVVQIPHVIFETRNQLLYNLCAIL